MCQLHGDAPLPVRDGAAYDRKKPSEPELEPSQDVRVLHPPPSTVSECKENVRGVTAGLRRRGLCGLNPVDLTGGWKTNGGGGGDGARTTAPYMEQVQQAPPPPPLDLFGSVDSWTLVQVLVQVRVPEENERQTDRSQAAEPETAVLVSSPPAGLEVKMEVETQTTTATGTFRSRFCPAVSLDQDHQGTSHEDTSLLQNQQKSMDRLSGSSAVESGPGGSCASPASSPKRNRSLSSRARVRTPRLSRHQQRTHEPLRDPAGLFIFHGLSRTQRGAPVRKAGEGARRAGDTSSEQLRTEGAGGVGHRQKEGRCLSSSSSSSSSSSLLLLLLRRCVWRSSDGREGSV
ncbi:hypothetical protein INR49_010311 [Caranx melampygus]|nr:hypothetical protein INR49_010311 [Caranx melampygus]